MAGAVERASEREGHEVESDWAMSECWDTVFLLLIVMEGMSWKISGCVVKSFAVGVSEGASTHGESGRIGLHQCSKWQPKRRKG